MPMIDISFVVRRVSLALLWLLCGFVYISAGSSKCAFAQDSYSIQAPDRKYLYSDERNRRDNKRNKKQELKNKKAAAEERVQSKNGQLPFGIDGKNIKFDSTGRKLTAEGGVIITYTSIVAEALKATVDVTTQEAELTGDVRITDIGSQISADRAYVNLDSGRGELENVDLFFADGDYQLQAEKLTREEEEVYTLSDTTLTTCRCPEGDCRPWSLHADDVEIEREGYGEAWDTTLLVNDVPVFYLPYLIFPAKSERQSGFIAPTFGGGGRRGFQLYLPFFWAIDHSTDATIMGILETRTRAGVDVEFRKFFSRDQTLQSGFVYLNESLRNGELQGTLTDGLSDPELDENRFGGYIDYSWRGKKYGIFRPQLLIDGNYVSDDLLVREYEKREIAEFNTRFVTSTAVLRTPLGSTFSLDLSSEFNQAMVADDDFVFQRLPELNLLGFNTLRPFGRNPFGLRVNLNTDASIVNFARTESFDGVRAELFEQIKLPFYYKNYFDGSLSASVRGSLYSLDETRIVSQSDDDEEEDTTDDTDGTDDTEEDVFEELDSSSNRLVPELGGSMRTVFEKVFEVDKDSTFKRIGEYGRIGRKGRLARVKHTVEPVVSYSYVPEVDQEDNPQFDSNDRLRQKSVVSYKLVQRLFARFEPLNQYVYGIEETTPELEDLGTLKTPGVNSSFGVQREAANDEVVLRRGSIVELANLELGQSFDSVEDRKDLDEDRDGLSDLSARLNILPNEHFRMRLRSNFNVQEQDLNSYSIESSLLSKRGDSLNTRLRFVERNVRQLESGVEFRVSDRLKLGYYGRYDDLNSEILEQRAGVRVYSECNCWIFDLRVTDRFNPDETRVAFNLTLVGLGEIGNTFFSNLNDDDS